MPPPPTADRLAAFPARRFLKAGVIIKANRDATVGFWTGLGRPPSSTGAPFFVPKAGVIIKT